MSTSDQNVSSTDIVSRSEDEWRAELSPEQFRVCRQQGTEPPFSGALTHCKEKGEYQCSCCGQPLFSSEAKYDSGSGWPSYCQPLSDEAVITECDSSHGMVRVEVKCACCRAHLGHIFPDGPQPTGMRYCINSVSLSFISANSLSID